MINNKDINKRSLLYYLLTSSNCFLPTDWVIKVSILLLNPNIHDVMVIFAIDKPPPNIGKRVSS